MGISAVIIIFVSIIFLYYGYKDDYKRDKYGFKTMIFRIIGTLICLLIVWKIIGGLNVPLKKILVERYPSELPVGDLNNMSPKDIQKMVEDHRKYERKIDLIVDVFDVLFLCVGFLVLNKFIAFFRNAKSN